MPQLKSSESEEAVLSQSMVEHLGSSLHCHIFSRCLCVYSVYKVKPIYILCCAYKPCGKNGISSNLF